MTQRPTPELEAFTTQRRAAGQLLGTSVDERDETVTLFVPAGEALAGLPYELDGFRVSVVPMPRAQLLRTVS